MIKLTNILFYLLVFLVFYQLINGINNFSKLDDSLDESIRALHEHNNRRQRPIMHHHHSVAVPPSYFYYPSPSWNDWY